MEMTHELKTIQPYFGQMANESKTFEIRKYDRNYQVGDKLKLMEWEPNGHYFTGLYRIKVISHILTDAEDFGLMKGFCILSFEV